MRVKMILPALTRATSPFFRPIKYSLFPPLGLATLAAYLRDDDEVEIQDEHVEGLRLDDAPDLVVIQVYIASAYRAYSLAGAREARGDDAAGAGIDPERIRHQGDGGNGKDGGNVITQRSEGTEAARTGVLTYLTRRDAVGFPFDFPTFFVDNRLQTSPPHSPEGGR
jgi:hypothetical protein